ncbi:MAG: DUF2695 domain-containing protein [Myxococcales bacterium]|nr:DUF2695 domain-containing protein [Myxococcales bacterium]
MLTYDDLPPDVQANLDLAYRAFSRRRYDEAIRGFTAVVDAYPAYIHGVFTLVRALRASDDRASANARLSAAAAIAPDDPRIELGLAWKALDAGDARDAEALATRALPRIEPELRGNVLAVLARAAEASGRTEDAARLFLEAYEAGTMLGWLEEHCRLAGIEYLDPGPDTIAPWPTTAVARRWMYAAIEAALVEAARAKDPAVPDGQVLITGCDGTARLTAAWARRAGVDRPRLYQALANRGGYCDCEVLLNATERDGADAFALVAGVIDGPLDEVVAALEDILYGDAPSEPVRLDPDAERLEHCLGIYLDEASARIPLQVTDRATVGWILRAMADRPPTRARLRLLVGFTDQAPAMALAGPDGATLRIKELDDGPVPSDLDAAWPDLAAQLAALRAGLPGPGA